MGFFDALTATAVSFTVAGNTGVAPFLSLFVCGILGRINPNLLNMGDSMQTLLSSWPGLTLLGVGTILDFVGHCIPVVDEIIDGAETIIIPIVSILGSLSTMGLYELPGVLEEFGDGDNRRRLSAATTALRVFQTFVACGIGLALCLHLFKMLVRIIGQGWLTGVLTVMEGSWCIFTIILAILIKPIAILVAAFICVAAVVGIKRHFFDKETTIEIQEDIIVTGVAASSPDAAEKGTSNYVKMSDGGNSKRYSSI